jgi:hypothetical protein
MRGSSRMIDPEPCACIREDAREASAGVRVGQPLSRDRKLFPGADAVCVAEGNMSSAPTGAEISGLTSRSTGLAASGKARSRNR